MGFLNNNIKRHIEVVKNSQILSKFLRTSNTALINLADKSDEDVDSNTDQVMRSIVKELISMGKIDLTQFLTNNSETVKCDKLIDISEDVEPEVAAETDDEKIVENNNLFSQDDLNTLYLMQFKGRCVEDMLDRKYVAHGYLKLEGEKIVDVDIDLTSSTSKSMLKTFQKPDLMCEIDENSQTLEHSTNELDDLYCLQFKTRCVDDYIDNTSEGVENAFVPFEAIGDDELYQAPLIDLDDGSKTKVTSWTTNFQANTDKTVIDWLKKLAKIARVNRADTIGENGCLRKRAGGKVADLRYVRPIEFD